MKSPFPHIFSSFRIFNPNAATPALIAGISLLCSVPTPAAQITILHSFGDGTVPNDGAYPGGPLIQASNGNFYGTANGTALNPDGSGMIYEMPLGGTVSAIYTFTGPNLAPGGLLFYNNGLIGVSEFGGLTNNGTQYGYGTIFSTTLSGQNTFLYTFQAPGTNSPSDPNGGLVLGPDGDLYGATAGGGTNSRGTAFKIDPTTGTLTILYNFTSYSASGALLLGQDGNFYGITYGGTIFKMTPKGVVTNLYTFSGITLGQGPLIQDAAGNFYGATGLNGTNFDGTVFKMTPQYTVTIIHSFDGTDGEEPNTPAIGPDGNLYGTTLDAGKNDGGTVYELSTDGSTFNVLHYFSDGTIQNDGWEPSGGLVLGSDKNFYGTTGGGGAMQLGTLYQVTP